MEDKNFFFGTLWASHHHGILLFAVVDLLFLWGYFLVLGKQHTHDSLCVVLGKRIISLKKKGPAASAIFFFLGQTVSGPWSVVDKLFGDEKIALLVIMKEFGGSCLPCWKIVNVFVFQGQFHSRRWPIRRKRKNWVRLDPSDYGHGCKAKKSDMGSV